ncbi:hypothetical protein AAVH_29704 [Aphelenchoides avenae]|nr:hypothetical protein AAVH_29704 [Aphelenchus avenae]
MVMYKCDNGENPGFCQHDPMLMKDGGTGLTILHFCDDMKTPSLSHVPVPKILDAPLDGADHRHIVVKLSLS